jgi:(heptosyl)LPS beta-1,4-glucosyltransferase
MSLTTIIHTKNAEKTLKAALESVKSISDELIIIDMESSDETIKIAKKYTETVFTHPDLGYADPARNFGLAKAKHDWILVLDADEELHSQLARFITEVVTGQVDSSLQADAYYLPRKNILFDKWIEHSGWWPDHQMRLFKRGKVKWRLGVHRLPDVEGTCLTLPAAEKYALIHHNYQTIEQYIERMNRYTEITAQETGASPKTLTSNRVVHAFGDEFFRRFFAEQGINDGVHGLSLSLLQAGYELVVQLKIWQRQGFPQKSEPTASITALRAFNRDLAYWLADWQIQQTTGLANVFWRIRRRFKI